MFLEIEKNDLNWGFIKYISFLILVGLLYISCRDSSSEFEQPRKKKSHLSLSGSRSGYSLANESPCFVNEICLYAWEIRVYF